jgi:transposase
MEGFARAISLFCNLLAATPRLDPLRRLSRRVGPAAGRYAPEAGDRLGNRDWRRLVHTGKKGGDDVGRTLRGNGTRILLMTDRRGTPLCAYTTAANHNEVTTIETLVDQPLAVPRPARLLYDKAADADWLREALDARGIELICPHRENRVKPAVQDGRSLRRYRSRWIVERTLSWLHNCRRLITRWEWHPELFEGFVHLACLYTILKRF